VRQEVDGDFVVIIAETPLLDLTTHRPYEQAVFFCACLPPRNYIHLILTTSLGGGEGVRQALMVATVRVGEEPLGAGITNEVELGGEDVTR